MAESQKSEINYICKFCEKKYKHKSSLNYHYNNSCREKPEVAEGRHLCGCGVELNIIGGGIIKHEKSKKHLDWYSQQPQGSVRPPKEVCGCGKTICGKKSAHLKTPRHIKWMESIKNEEEGTLK